MSEDKSKSKSKSSPAHSARPLDSHTEQDPPSQSHPSSSFADPTGPQPRAAPGEVAKASFQTKVTCDPNQDSIAWYEIALNDKMLNNIEREIDELLKGARPTITAEEAQAIALDFYQKLVASVER